MKDGDDAVVDRYIQATDNTDDIDDNTVKIPDPDCCCVDPIVYVALIRTCPLYPTRDRYV